MASELTTKQEQKVTRMLSTGQRGLIKRRAKRSAVSWGVGTGIATGFQSKNAPLTTVAAFGVGTAAGVGRGTWEYGRLKMQNRKTRKSYSIPDFYAMADNENKVEARKTFALENKRKRLNV